MGLHSSTRRDHFLAVVAEVVEHWRRSLIQIESRHRKGLLLVVVVAAAAVAVGRTIHHRIVAVAVVQTSYPWVAAAAAVVVETDCLQVAAAVAEVVRTSYHRVVVAVAAAEAVQINSQ